MYRYGKQFLLAGLLVLASAVQAAGANNQCDVKAGMFVQLAGAKTESAGRLAESVIWEYWFDQSPTTEVRSLLDRGRERREAYDYEAAENLFDQVVDQAPKYHEQQFHRQRKPDILANDAERSTGMAN